MGLRIYLLGQFKLQAGDLPVELPSRPAQSLLAYLALNAGVVQRREKLASLLWPDATETNARSYLRQALWRIRKALDSASLSANDFLQISDISVTFDDQADCWLDAAKLLETNTDQSAEELIEAVSLYQGELLPGFYDEWVVLERDRLERAYHQKMNLLLDLLIQSEQWDEALEWSEEWIRLGYEPEAAFRALMTAHAGLGDLGMVNSTYQRCVDSLNQQLDIEPSTETQMLYERLRASDQQDVLPTAPQSAAYAVNRPAFLEVDELQPIEKAIFVSRERELGQMDAQLRLALTGKGRVIFITGEAGSGKTMLIQEFTQQAQANYTDLIVASGNCNAHTGIGDPYLPFRQILELLTGDVEARWAAGAVSGEHARLLWNMLPITVKGLVESGPDLVETFVSGQPLLDRAADATPQNTVWLPRLKDIVERQRTISMIPAPQQSDLFEQYARVLGTLSMQVPLMLVVDDLQWADTGSVGLLFHLGRHLPGSRILIVGAYRPEEVEMGRQGERHPLKPVINEFQREFGDNEINLGQAESRAFVEAIVDSESNRLGPSFRQMLFLQSHGHPLFTIELIRGMQERGDIQQDQDGRWVEGSALDWETLPARVEAVIAERIERLPQPERAVLRVGSVEGVEFSAEVVAKVLGRNEREMIQSLSSDLDRKHRLVHAQAIERLGTQRLSRYRFRHFMFQKYLYDKLDPVERAYLHEDVGAALEQIYGDQIGEISAIAVQLARHYQEANIIEKAVQFLQLAGEKAVQLSAYQEGITHLTRGLELLYNLPESGARDELELGLQLSLGKAWLPGPKSNQAYTRAQELCLQLGKTSQFCRVLGELSIHQYVNAEYHKARELEEEALSLAQQAGDQLIVAISHWYLGFVAFALGEFTTALDHLEQTIAIYDPEQHHHAIVVLRGSDVGTSAMSYAACSLWCLGYPDQALKLSQESLALARELRHSFSLADVLNFSGCLFNAMRRNWLALDKYSEQMLDLVIENRLQAWLGAAKMNRGEALIMLGQIEEGEKQLCDGLALTHSIDVISYTSGKYSFLAEGKAQAGQIEQALTTLDEALPMIEGKDERYWEAEHHRKKAKLLRMKGDEAAAEVSLLKAVDVARKQKAKSWELRAATDLARLWDSQGKVDEAHHLLAPVYEWFTEGFDTPDLIAAKGLLDDLA